MTSDPGAVDIYKLWNAAVSLGVGGDAPPDSPRGMISLAYWLNFDNLIASGGMLFAFEVADARKSSAQSIR